MGLPQIKMDIYLNEQVFAHKLPFPKCDFKTWNEDNAFFTKSVIHWGPFCDNLRTSQLKQGLSIITLVDKKITKVVIYTADGLINTPHHKPGPCFVLA